MGAVTRQSAYPPTGEVSCANTARTSGGQQLNISAPLIYFPSCLVAEGDGTAAEVHGETPSKVSSWPWHHLKGRHGVPLRDEPMEDVHR